MRTLTVKQPWAHLICAGIKDIENRTWKTNYRGRALIHASADRKTNYDALTSEQYLAFVNAGIFNEKLIADKLSRSAIIGSVEIVDCVINHQSIWAEKSNGVMVGHTFVHKENEKPTYNWILANPILFDKPILNVKGKLNFWEYDLKTPLCPNCGNPTHCQFIGDMLMKSYCLKCNTTEK